MTPAELMADLIRQNVRVWTEGDQLKVRAPKGVLTPEIRQQLHRHKSDVLLLLRSLNDSGERSLPAVIPDPIRRYEPFPLTDIQQAYWVGRSDAFALGNVSCHLYWEVDADNLDLERFNIALQILIDRHDMLRATVLADGRQRILDHVPRYVIETIDLRGCDSESATLRLEAVRERMSHQVLPSDRWPLFEISASHLDENRIRLHFSFDMLIVDGFSLQILFREWFQLYEDPNASLSALDLSFRDYVLREAELQNTEAFARSREYWTDRIKTLPPGPDLPLAASPESVRAPRFVRRSGRLDPTTWRRLKSRAIDCGLTTSAALLAAFAEVVAAWSRSPRFTLNITLLNRLPLHAQVNNILGDFTTFIPLEVNYSREDSYLTRARGVQMRLLEDVEHRLFSGIRLMREIAQAQKRPMASAMPVVFTSLLSQERARAGAPRSLWMGEVVYGISQTPQVWLDHQVYEEDGALVFNWDAVDSLFPEGLLDEMFEAYCSALIHLTDEKTSWEHLYLRTAPERALVQRGKKNNTSGSRTLPMLHTLFVDQARNRPAQEAVVTSDRIVTYQELQRAATYFSRRLRESGARPNSLVAVVMDKGWEQVAAVLGILQSGAAYLPIDARLPRERVHYLLEHGEARIALTQPWLEKTLSWPEEVQTFSVEPNQLAGGDDEPLESLQNLDDLAYVTYTSGSTGLPKGVMITHRGASNTICDLNRRFEIGSRDRVLALSDLSFDLSVYDIFGTLAAGGTIVLPEPGATRDPSRLAKLISRQNVTVWNSVPALAEMLVDYAGGRRHLIGDSLRLFLLSGDWIPLALPDRIRSLAAGSQVISLGGATEASIWSVIYPIEQVEPHWRSIPYGQPMENQSLHVLNEALQPCPVWTTGQLYIGGEGLASGYWRDEEKTSISFINHPQTGERLYKTGDLCRYLPDGNLEFLGREDLQVKIQGHRIELGEIEAALAQHPGVKAAVAAAHGAQQGVKRIIAYLVLVAEPGPATEELREFLKAKLPSYMIPSKFITIESLPLSSNGKVDRKALLERETESFEGRHDLNGSATLAQARVNSCIAEVLGAEYINPQASLIELGANSIDFVKIASLLEQEFGWRPALERLYLLRSIAELGEYYEQSSPNYSGAQSNDQSDSLFEHQVLLDPAAREEFKNKGLGLRIQSSFASQVQLESTESNQQLRERYLRRGSRRTFSTKPVALDRFGRFLGCLRRIEIDRKSKSLYASAGGLYPVQVYLGVKVGRVENLAAGIYYYHPVSHRLGLVSEGVEIDRNIHEPFINRPIFDEAAFSIFLLAELRAIAPLYGERSLHFATIEAGLISQLLEMSAPAEELGLCQIGSVDFKPIARLFDLGDSHVLVHSLVGGSIEDRSDAWTPVQEPHFRLSDAGKQYEEGHI